MRKSYLCSFVALLLLTFTARADSFTFQFSGPAHSGSGTLSASATGTPGEFLVTDIAGMVDGLAITSLLPPGTYPSDVPNDNSFFFPATADTPYFDDSGVSFELSDGTDINIYYGTYGGVGTILGPGYILIEGDAETASALTSLTVSTNMSSSAITPEPSSLVLFAVGLASVALLPGRLREPRSSKA